MASGEVMAMVVKQRRIVIALSIAIALTRLLAIAHSLFDWDEALFSLGVREYDVVRHQPHPPGYPLFIALAKIVALSGVDEFRCIQLVVILGALFIFPALYWLAREIGFDFTTAVAGAAVYAFLPNVWVYGGTGFSDVPATVLVFAACALLLRGRRDARAYIAGAVVLGIAAGFRPANLLVGAVPALLATGMQWRAKRYRAIAAAMLLGFVIAAGSYLGAALASLSIGDYVDVVRAQSEYVRDVDSWRSPTRPPLLEVAREFILRPFGQEDVLNALAIGALLSAIAALVRRRVSPLLTLAIFTPLAVMTWLNLDVAAKSRYAIGYMAAHALLAADGFLLFGRKVQVALCVAVVLVFFVWTWPALETQRASDSPPVTALRWARDHVPQPAVLYVTGEYRPHARYMLPDRTPIFFGEVEEIPSGDAWVVDWRLQPVGRSFTWPHKALRKVIRHRNFEASVTRAAELTRFGEGWYPFEASASGTYRWMKKEGTVLLPAMRGSGVLSLRLRLPLKMLTAPPAIDVMWNGRKIDRIAGSAKDVERSWILPSRADAANELRIVTSETVVPAKRGNSIDTRELGLRLERLSWTPAH